MERHTGVFEYGADLDGELLLAVAALLEAHANALGFVRRDRADTVASAAMRANRRASPNYRFEVREGGGFIVKVGLAQDRHCSLRS